MSERTTHAESEHLPPGKLTRSTANFAAADRENFIAKMKRESGNVSCRSAVDGLLSRTDLSSTMQLLPSSARFTRRLSFLFGALGALSAFSIAHAQTPAVHSPRS